MREFNRFETNFNEVNFIDSNNQKMNPNNFCLNKEEFQTPLNVGDVVKLRNLEYLVKIKFVNFNVNGLGFVDFAGSKVGDSTGDLVLFNKKDIEEKIEEPKKIK